MLRAIAATLEPCLAADAEIGVPTDPGPSRACGMHGPRFTPANAPGVPEPVMQAMRIADSAPGMGAMRQPRTIALA